jgi:hypothetical protein
MSGKEEFFVDNMTSDEFDLLDELYFVTSYHELKGSLDWSEDRLYKTLVALDGKAWIKCMNAKSEELPTREIDLKNAFREYHYLATKQGLLAHNGR